MSQISREEVVARDDALTQQMNAHFSELCARVDRISASLVKWMVGIALAFFIGSITFMTFVVQNASQKAAQLPCVSHCACQHSS